MLHAEITQDCDAPVEPLAVSPRRAGELLSLSQATIYRLLDKGSLKAAKIGGATRISMASIKALAGVQ